MSLLRKAPCLLLSLFFGVILLILACITANRACYDQPYFYQYAKVVNGADQFADDCNYFCGGPAVKLIGTPYTATANNGDPNYPPLWQMPVGRVVRCPWEHTGKRLFLALSSLMVLWFIIELLLVSYRKFNLIASIMDLLVLGLAIPTAIYLINDLYNTDCQTWENRGFKCYSSIFNVSFILLICAMVAMLFNFLWNLIRRKRLNEKDPKYSNIPQQKVPTEPVVVNEVREVVVNEVRAPSENRIA